MDRQRLAALALLALLADSSWAQSVPSITATYREAYADGWDETTTFKCQGQPTCTGTFSTHVREAGCSNYLDFSGKAEFSGVSVSQSGSFSGTLTTRPGFPSFVNKAGVCAFGTMPPEGSAPYTASYDAATKTGTLNLAPQPGVITFPFKVELAVPAPVFPMVVRSSIGPLTSTAEADLQYRAQDVGTSGSVFVFAAAPAAIVRGSSSPLAMRLGKADASSCVLGQLDASGRLVAVTNAQFQAALSGVLSAQGATVSIMNNVSTPDVAGATFYVGYGATGATMVDGGVFRNAVLVPGSGVCPMLPYATALWWNPEESGWGLNLNQQGNTAFGTLFTYDAARAPSWFVMSGGTLQADGLTFTGDLYRTTGPAFDANPFTPIGPGNVTKVGTMAVAFSHANAATLTYSVNGTTVTKSIQRQVYGSRSANCLPSSSASRAGASQYQDLWWNADESGWGLNLTHQDQTLFGTLFTYDATGRDVWLVMSGGTRQGDGSYQGTLYKTSGGPFNASPFTPVGAGDVAAVGTMRIAFTDGDHGTLTYSYSGATVSKAITRQVFSAPVSACN
jgi:hypothetical protein